MGFEEWWASEDTRYPDVKSAARDAWSACETAMNREAGISANEAGKVERRKVAVEKLIKLAGPGVYEQPAWDAIIKVAQG